MKKIRFLAFALTLIMALPLFASCSSGGELAMPQETKTEEDVETQPVPSQTVPETNGTEMIPQSPEEENIMKILILGNSHSNDVFFQLARVFNAQGYEKKVKLGFLYYSGCSITQHVDFATMNKPVYDYYESSGDWWISQQECTMKRALEDHQWDVILLQAAKSDLTEDLNLGLRRRLEEFVNKYVPTQHEFAWHTSWPSPNDETFFSDDYWRKAPAGYKDNLIRLYGFNPINQFTVLTDAAKNHILTDPTYKKAICTGAGIMYATQTLGISQLAIYRDYTHLNDFGRLIAAYSFYTQFTGQPIEEVKLDKIPARHRQSHYTKEGDFILTDEVKEIIKQCANYALENPWAVPGK